MNFVKILLPAIIATTLAWLPAGAVDTRKIELTMTVGGKPYDVVAEPFASWQLASEGQISLDQKFNIQPDGASSLIQVKIAPGASGQKNPSPVRCSARAVPVSEKIRPAPVARPQAADQHGPGMFNDRGKFTCDNLLLLRVVCN